MFSGYGNQVQTQRSHLGQCLVASHSVWRLVISFVTVQIVQWVVYILDCNYYIFLERVGTELLMIIQYAPELVLGA